MRKLMRMLTVFLAVVLLAACKSTRVAIAPIAPKAPTCLYSKLQLTVPYKGDKIGMGGYLKMKSGERIQLSIQLPIIRTEVVRLDITPEEVLLIDRMNKQFVRASKSELTALFPKGVDYAKLEKLLFDASLPGGKSVLTGKELGLSSLSDARLQLYDFSTAEIELVPSEVSAKYTQVELNDLIKMLLNL
ncbi:DUF4292 domain-containing protein [uncultured Bacteroides sp.]|uniref:DUF4292 domain-containing protein n=1 Tax=uncultured Bacteroides sp. TaxID=162156 RepID=UPI002AA70759|nr:DUF4292 domain-containing protein [uncultured Bacteroides sp.]